MRKGRKNAMTAWYAGNYDPTAEANQDAANSIAVECIGCGDTIYVDGDPDAEHYCVGCDPETPIDVLGFQHYITASRVA
jgi:hypothetical protein